jgi:hypothetical protein
VEVEPVAPKTHPLKQDLKTYAEALQPAPLRMTRKELHHEHAARLLNAAHA